MMVTIPAMANGQLVMCIRLKRRSELREAFSGRLGYNSINGRHMMTTIVHALWTLVPIGLGAPLLAFQGCSSGRSGSPRQEGCIDQQVVKDRAVADRRRIDDHGPAATAADHVS